MNLDKLLIIFAGIGGISFVGVLAIMFITLAKDAFK